MVKYGDTMKNVFYNLQNNIKEYLYRTEGNLDNFYTILKQELKSYGFIDGGDNVVWKSPDHMYIFEISRFCNTYIPTPSSPKYTNTIKVKSNLGNTLAELKLNEKECIDFLYLFAEVFYERYQSQFKLEYSNEVIFRTSLSNTAMESDIIKVNFSNSNPNVLKFTILHYTPKYQQLQEIMHTVLSVSEFVQLCYLIFFQCIIDLNIEELEQDGYGEILFAIEGFIYGDYIKDL